MSAHNRIREWRQKKALTLQALAEGCGTTKAQIDKLEKGERRLTVEWMVRLAKSLGCDPRELLPDEILPPLPPTQTASPQSLNNIPIFGTTDGTSLKNLILTKTPIGQTDCPGYLAHVPDAYAIYVADQTMAPRYRTGQLLYLDPHKPPQTGNGVVIIAKNKHVQIAELVERGEKSLFLRHYSPKKRDFETPLADINALHTVVGSKEP